MRIVKNRPIVEESYEDILIEAFREANSVMHQLENIRHFLNESKTLHPNWADVATLGHITEKLREFNDEYLSGYYDRLNDADYDALMQRAEKVKKGERK